MAIVRALPSWLRVRHHAIIGHIDTTNGEIRRVELFAAMLRMLTPQPLHWGVFVDLFGQCRPPHPIVYSEDSSSTI